VFARRPCSTSRVRTTQIRRSGKSQLELIEGQTGSDFGEDDIIRIEDDYQRA
jgi:mannose-1-phosphate guanylyltransferase/mannose-6-phosphate isomerase